MEINSGVGCSAFACQKSRTFLVGCGPYDTLRCVGVGRSALSCAPAPLPSTIATAADTTHETRFPACMSVLTWCANGNQSPRRQAPHPHRAVEAARDRAAAVVRECDAAHRVGVARQLVQLLACARV